MVAHKIAMNVGPEFLHLVCDGIPTDLCSPNVYTASERPRPGMVGIGDGCGRATTEDFRKVELGLSRVRARYQDPRAGVCRTVEKAPLSQLVVARILSQRGRV